MKNIIVAYLLPSFYSKPESVGRWIFSFLLSFLIIVLLLFLIFSAKREMASIEMPAPMLLLDYIVIEDKKPPQKPKKIIKPQPVVEEIEKNLPLPEAEAEVAPSETPTETADIVSKQNVIVKKEIAKFIRIHSTNDLDNTDFTPIFNPKPPYPKVALLNNLEGYVDVDLIIDRKGMVVKFSITKVYGHALFGSAVSKVVSQWRFPPPRMKGEKIKVKYLYRINFRIN